MVDDTQTAQGQTTETESPANSSPAQETPNQQFEGLQRRINELVAKQHAAERDRDSERQRNQELTMQMVAQASMARLPAPEPVEIDPDLKKAMDAYWGPQVQSLRAELVEAKSAAARAQAQASVTGLPPALAKRSQEIWADWVRRGADRTMGVTFDNAINWAKGEMFDTLSSGGKPAQWSATPPAASQQSLVPPPSGASGGKALPANFGDLDPDKQLALLESRLGDKTF